MKNKKYISLILVLVFLIGIPNAVNAFSSSDAESAVNDGETYLEILDPERKFIAGPFTIESTSKELYKYKQNFTHNCNNIETEKIILHTYTEKSNIQKFEPAVGVLKDECTKITTSGTNCDVKIIEKKHEAQFIGNNAVELIIEVTPSALESNAVIKMTWGNFVGNNFTQYEIEINIKLTNYVNNKVANEERKKAEEDLAKAEEEAKKLETAYLNEPGIDATAKEIKNFILSDKQYNESKKIKEIANSNKPKIEAWYNTVVELIKSDYHYAGENQYGAIRSILLELKDASTSTDIDDAINNNSESLDSTYELTDASNKRVVEGFKEILYALKSDDGEDRKNDAVIVDVLANPGDYNPDRNPGLSGTDEDVIEDMVSKILSAITSIGTVVSVLISAIIGIKYMLGSVEEKAEYKKDMIPYFVGAVLLFGICAIVKMLQQFGDKINIL